MKVLFSSLLTLVVLWSYAQKNTNKSDAYKELEQRIIALEKKVIAKSNFGINIQDHGVLPTNSAQQNSLSIEKLINSLPTDHSTLIFIPEGEYQFSNTIKIFNKAVRIEGVDDVKLIFQNGVSGIYISRNQYTLKCVLKNLTIETRGGKKNKEAHGITANSITYLESLRIRNFAGNVVNFIANISTEKTDVSASKVEDVEVKECGGHGFYMQGGDANQITFLHCDARDNGGVGFMDNSFLGNQFISCMAHNNKGGHYKVLGANARSNIAFCYGEGDGPASEINGHSNVWGGIHQNGIKTGPFTNAIMGAQIYRIRGSGFKIEEGAFSFGDINLRGNPEGNYSYNFRNVGRQSNLFQFFGENATLKEWDNAERKVPFAGVSIKHYFIGQRIVLFARSVEDLKKWGYFGNFQFINGDRVYNTEFTEGEPEKWICIQGGVLGKAKWKPFY